MLKTYTEVRLFLASPGDVTEERDRLLLVVNEFNEPNGLGDELGLNIKTLDWRFHVAPLMGRPEAVLLQQLPLDTWDIFVGLMWQRFGTATGGADPRTGLLFDSGTHEEFTLAHQAWQERQRPQILFYRCMRPLDPANFDPEKYLRVKNFFAQFAPHGEHPGFYKEFKTAEEFERSARRDLEKVLRALGKQRDASASNQSSAKTPPEEPAATRAEQHEQKQRYLDCLLAAHQYLPVAGFETNLRIPIPLEKVYVTLRARMSELERMRDEPFAQPQDRTVPVQEALQFALERKYDGLIILGDPGSGKTTLAKHFLLCFATHSAEKKLGLQKPLLPILLLLREVQPERSLVENILSALQKYALGLDENFFLSYLREGRALLLLDGLDEVPTETERAHISRWIHEQAHLAFPRCPLLVTSRFSGYRGDAVLRGHYLRLEIQDYDLGQVRQFLENWLNGVETHLHEDSPHWREEASRAAAHLLQQIEASPALRELAVNPLMLQIIALVHRDRRVLPDRRVELYKECTDVLLERWDKAKGLEVLLSATQARQLLQPIALWMHSEENRREVHQAALLEFMQPILPRIKREVNAETLLQSWAERSGIFKGEGEIYFFHHLSFQEYLAAEEIRNSRQVEILVKNFDHAWWREPTLLAMGLTNPPIFAEFMAALLRAKWRDGARVDFMLRCIDEALVKSEEPFAQALRRLQRFEAKYYALLALERLGTETAEAALQYAAKDKNEQIAKHALAILMRKEGAVAKAEVPTVRVKVDGKTRELPSRIFNPFELNAEYILIPGGEYKFSVTQKPTQVPPLYFAKYPVTNQLYRRFIAYLEGQESAQELRALLPLEQFAQSLFANAKQTKGFAEYLGRDSKDWPDKLRSDYDNEKRFNGESQPVVGVTWFAAAAYTYWLNEQQRITSNQQPATRIFRLPNEAEWEWAAGKGQRKYPWGNEEPDASRANYDRNVGQTTPVGAYPAGATTEGLMDMAGNVWEWMENRYDEKREARALRGGSWINTAGDLRGVARNYIVPDVRGSNVGFRVVRFQSFF